MFLRIIMLAPATIAGLAGPRERSASRHEYVR
jgi:hypothetical protein